MWQQLATALAAGIAVGPSCLLHCGVFHAAFLNCYAAAPRRQSAGLGAALLGGRLLAYLLVGALIGLAASRGVPLLRSWVLFLALGVLMMASAVRPRRQRACACGVAVTATGAVTGALLLGFVSGLSPCPPFLASGLIALRSHGVGMAVLTMLAFFAGSSIYLLPVWFGLGALPAGLRRRLGLASRAIAAIVALYAFGATAMILSHRGDVPTEPPPGRTRAAAGATLGNMRPPAETAPDAETTTAAARVEIPPPAPPETEPLFPKEPPTRRFTADLLRRLNLSLREAMYYTPLEDDMVRCNLCPTGCVLENGQQGMCRARVNVAGKLRSIVFGRPVSAKPDPVEKKPLFHVLPGSRAYSIATVGCNLGCVFCQNFQISQAAPEEIRHISLSPEQVLALTVQSNSQGIAYTYTEPTVFFEYMLETAKLARTRNIKNYWITCGQIEEAPLLELCQVLDAANVDLKGFSDVFYVKYCNAHLYPVLRTLKILRREGVHVEVTNLVIPGANDHDDMLRDMCRWIVQELGRDTPLHFSRFHPAYKLLRRPATPLSTLKRAREIAHAEGLRYVYIGNVREPGLENTKCPTCGKTLIRRSGYYVEENHVRDGHCEFCGAPIPGLWE